MADERRVESRIPVDMWVEEVTEGDRYFQRSGNLSRGGMFLEGTISHPRGTFVQLKFTLPGETDPISIRGEVTGRPDAEHLGMHVRFVQVSAELDARLVEFLGRTGQPDGA